MTAFISRVTSMTILPENEAIYSEQATVISIEDEGGGEFLTIEQVTDSNHGEITIGIEEWAVLRNAIEIMFIHCQPIKKPI